MKQCDIVATGQWHLGRHHYGTHLTCTVPCRQLGFMALWSFTAKHHHQPEQNWNCDSMDHDTCYQLSRVQLVKSWTLVRLCLVSWCWQEHLGDGSSPKEQWTNLIRHLSQLMPDTIGNHFMLSGNVSHEIFPVYHITLYIERVKYNAMSHLSGTYYHASVRFW